MRFLSFLAILCLENELYDVSALGPIEGYTQLTLTNPRYANGRHFIGYLHPEGAIDGRVDWDDEFYSQVPWGQSADSFNGATISSSHMDEDFYLDLETPSHVSIIKIYPRQGCCYDRYAYWDAIRIYDGINGGQADCTTTDDLSLEAIPNYTYSGITWECPPITMNNILYPATGIFIGAGGSWIQLTEVEAFVVNPLTTLYQPQNLVLRNYASELLHQFVNRSSVITNVDHTINNLLTHGCWCAKLNKLNPYLEFLGGPDAVDELDEICRNWFKCRNCNDRLQGGSCNVQYSSSMEILRSRSYTLKEDLLGEFIDTIQCAIANDACTDDSCSIDLLYLKKIFNYLEDNHDVLSPFLVHDNSTCSSAVNTNRTRICTGTVPYLTPVVNDAEKYISEGWKRPDEFCDNGNQYAGTDVVHKLFEQSANWHDAREYCQSLGDGITLARIFCHAEKESLRTLCINAQKIAWVGANDITSEGTWVWANADGTDGIAIESTGGWTIPWSGSEPNNWGGNQDCMNFNDNFSNFNDNYCSATLNAFICEKRFYN